MIGFAIPSAAYIALREHLNLYVNVEHFLQFFLLQVLVHISLLSLVQPYAEIASIVAIETCLLVQYSTSS